MGWCKYLHNFSDVASVCWCKKTVFAVFEVGKTWIDTV